MGLNVVVVVVVVVDALLDLSSEAAACDDWKRACCNFCARLALVLGCIFGVAMDLLNDDEEEDDGVVVVSLSSFFSSPPVVRVSTAKPPVFVLLLDASSLVLVDVVAETVPLFGFTALTIRRFDVVGDVTTP